MKKTITPLSTDFFYWFDQVWSELSTAIPEKTDEIRPGNSCIQNILNYSKAVEFCHDAKDGVYNNVMN